MKIASQNMPKHPAGRVLLLAALLCPLIFNTRKRPNHDCTGADCAICHHRSTSAKTC